MAFTITLPTLSGSNQYLNKYIKVYYKLDDNIQFFEYTTPISADFSNITYWAILSTAKTNTIVYSNTIGYSDIPSSKNIPIIISFILGVSIADINSIDIISLTGNIYCNEFLVTETNAIPSIDDPNWSTISQTQFIFN